MSQALAVLFAYAFRASGRKRLLEEDFVQLLAHERRFFPPSRVRALVQAGRGSGLLRSAGAHAFELSPDARDLGLPFDYRPDPAEVERVLGGPGAPAEAAPLFRRLVRAVSAATHESETELVAAVNRLQQEHGGLLTAEAAAFVLARLRGVDVGDLGEELERSFQRSPSAAGAR